MRLIIPMFGPFSFKRRATISAAGERKHDICWRREQERPQIAESRHSYGYAP
jgi:hypothetical protein